MGILTVDEEMIPKICRECQGYWCQTCHPKWKRVSGKQRKETCQKKDT